MYYKKCTVCEKEVEVETQEELDKEFRRYKEWNLNKCRECENAEHREKYKSGSWNGKKKENPYENESRLY